MRLDLRTTRRFAVVFTFMVALLAVAVGCSTKSKTKEVRFLLVITTDSLPAANVGIAYNQNLGAAGGTMPYTWSLTAGALPGGLNLSADGLISGTPAAKGFFNFTVQVADSSGAVAVKDLAVDVSGDIIITTDSPLPDAVLDTAYNVTLQVAGGTAPYDWSLISGTLPTGLSLAANGEIAGTPEESGDFDFTVQVMDSAAETAVKAFMMSVYDTQPDEWVDTFDDDGKIAVKDYVVVESGMAGLERGSTGSTTEELDQILDSGSGAMTSSPFGQTFTAGLTGKLTRISVKCGSGGSPTNITMTLSEGGVSATATAYVTTNTWYDFVFDAQPSVVAGTQYKFMLTPDSGSMEIDWNPNNNSYPFGEIVTRQGLNVSGDLLFKTYVITEDGFVSDTGTMTSAEIAPATVSKWIRFSFTDSEPTAADTDVKYTVEAWNVNSSAWDVPALTDASGNGNGQLDEAPVDLSGLDAAVYTKLRLTATLTTADVTNLEGPSVEEWKVTYQP